LTLAETVLSLDQLDDGQRVEVAYLATVGRQPSTTESQRAVYYVNDFQAQAAELLAPEFLAAASRTADAAEPENQSAAARKLAAAQQATAQVANPDDVDQADSPVKDEVVQARDAQSAAWASLIQALMGSAEFRYVR
jgi:hypothetical protein